MVEDTSAMLIVGKHHNLMGDAVVTLTTGMFSSRLCTILTVLKNIRECFEITLGQFAR